MESSKDSRRDGGLCVCDDFPLLALSCSPWLLGPGRVKVRPTWGNPKIGHGHDERAPGSLCEETVFRTLDERVSALVRWLVGTLLARWCRLVGGGLGLPSKRGGRRSPETLMSQRHLDVDCWWELGRVDEKSATPGCWSTVGRLDASRKQKRHLDV